MSKLLRKYGSYPFKIALLHGGPGAPGYMAPIARELSQQWGILEPLQSQHSVQAQIDELASQLASETEVPLTLIGSSWGAMLSLFFTAQYPYLVKKLILVGCGTFDAKSSAQADRIRLARLSPENQSRVQQLLQTPSNRLNELVDILLDADVYEGLTRNLEALECQDKLFNDVWNDFVSLRDKPHYITHEFSKIKVPVILIHGDYDPHPLEEIHAFLKNCIPTIQIYRLEKCGHYPWIEKYAKDRFFEILKSEL